MLRVFLVLSVLSLSCARPNENKVPQNVVTVPPNCPVGQEWINGQCRDIWIKGPTPAPSLLNNDETQKPKNVITVPPNCEPGQELIDGVCRDIWRGSALTNDDAQKPKNVITVPPNCAPGQQLVNGVCRDIWRGGDLADSKLFQNLLEKLWAQTSEFSRQTKNENAVVVDEDIPIEDRNIIDVPNHCPIGYKPDALGICRKVL